MMEDFDACEIVQKFKTYDDKKNFFLELGITILI